MHRTYSKFSFQSSKLHYSVYGNSEKILLMFHGFGHTHKNMREIEEALSLDYKVYSFDLFFHGFSEWNNEDKPLTSEFWNQLIAAFLKQNQIEKFSVLGFSLGGKLALSLVDHFANDLEKLYLIAPDGLKTNFWYSVATSKPLKGLFRKIILNPDFFNKLLKVLTRFKFLDKSSARFASIQMNSRDKRRRVYYTWTVLKGITPNLLRVVESLNAKAISTELFVGEYDRIIPMQLVRSFSDRLLNKKFIVLKSGHNNLLDEVAFQFENAAEKR